MNELKVIIIGKSGSFYKVAVANVNTSQIIDTFSIVKDDNKEWLSWNNTCIQQTIDFRNNICELLTNGKLNFSNKELYVS